MAQVGWVFLDDRGGRHRVGLYHGDQSGHVVIHCNLRVVQIDFSVKESKTYSFFIDDELCEVILVQEKEGFTYDFQVNKTVNTPRNQERRQEERRNRGYILLLLGGIAALVAAVLVGAHYFEKSQLRKRTPGPLAGMQVSQSNLGRLRSEGAGAEAHFFLVKEEGRSYVFYGFRTSEGKQVSGRYPVDASEEVLMPNGFPLNDNDAFMVRYLPAAPETHLVDFFQPTPSTLESYLDRAVDAESIAHPDAGLRYSRCLVTLAMNLRGWPSLAHIIYQGETPAHNSRYNRDSYRQLVRSDDMQKGLQEKCWDQ